MVYTVLALVAFAELAFLFQSFVLSHSTTQLGAVLPAVVVALTNQERASDQLSTLTTNNQLTEAAKQVAQDMASRGYFAHESPDGKSPWYWLRKAGYAYQYAGQNLAVNFDDSSQLLTAWMNSPEHKENILGVDYTEIGVGMATGTYNGKEAVYVVQFFASPLKHAAVVAKKTSTPKKPKIAVENATTSVVAVAPTGAAVLGAEVEQPKPTLPLSVWEKILASPGKYATIALGLLALFFICMLLLGFLPFTPEMLHHKAALNGIALVAVLVGIIIVNQRFLTAPLSLPTDSQNAAVVLALPN